MFFVNKVKQYMKLLCTCYLRLAGQSLDEIILNSLLIIIAAAYHYILFGEWVGIFHNTFLVVFLFEMFILLRAIYWIIRYGRRKKIYGYLRPDNTIEIHIGTARVNFEFTLIKSIRYAQKNGHLIEYTSAYLSYGELMHRFGHAVVSVKPISLLARIINSILAESFMGNNASYSVAHPLN
ncbi:hypothetical protein [Paenibacillus agricola]|uniref:DUF304 domain-containing protein n=1 Tax=Paenibacillus agricola TaxID=2716264 RepID=A0ABX0JEM6_9BACL|nr:hypothetical protein [Paenibacillus agricola]NHN33342.1 hypothetical protein [Paenibacillus agricola]